MKITKRQLRRIIKEEKTKLLRENSLTTRVANVDTGRMVKVSARPEPHYGFINLSFENSFQIALDGEGCMDLIEMLTAAQEEMRSNDDLGPEEDNSASVDAFLNAVPSAERA